MPASQGPRHRWRSSLRRDCRDLSARQVLQEVLRIRPKAWPNLRIIELGDALLSRNGEMIAAATEIYRLQLETRPHLAEFMTTRRTQPGGGGGTKFELDVGACSLTRRSKSLLEDLPVIAEDRTVTVAHEVFWTLRLVTAIG